MSAGNDLHIGGLELQRKITQGTMVFTFRISAFTTYQIPNKIFLATLQKMKENHVQLSTVQPNSSHTHSYSNYTKPRAIRDHSITCHPAEVALMPFTHTQDQVLNLLNQKGWRSKLAQALQVHMHTCIAYGSCSKPPTDHNEPTCLKSISLTAGKWLATSQVEYHVVPGPNTIRPTQLGYRETSYIRYHPISLALCPETWPL